MPSPDRRPIDHRMPAPPGPRPARLRVAWAALCCACLGLPCPAGVGDYWVVQTRACPQVLGSDPWPDLVAQRLDDGRPPALRDPGELIDDRRTLVLLVHGSYLSAGQSAGEGRKILADLRAFGALPPDAVVAEFDWPSQVVFANPVRDANEKARRAFVAGYHLACLLRELPPGRRVSVVGHSHGGLVVLSALQLLGGGTLSDGAAAVRLADPGLKARLRVALIAPAVDRHWIGPGQRLDRALATPEGLLCLYNPADPVLPVHPLGHYSDHRLALGQAGMPPQQIGLLGRSLLKYRQRDIAADLGPRHTFAGSIARPTIARSLTRYLWAGPQDRPAAQPQPGDAGADTGPE